MDPVKKLVPFAVFFVVANPETFKCVRSLLGKWVASADGIPTTAGLLLHALVFVILAHFMWRLVWGAKKSRAAPVKEGEGDIEVVKYPMYVTMPTN